MTLLDTQLAGKTAVVAGATGQVGAALVRRLLAAGAKVALPVRKPWQVEKLKEAFAAPGVFVGCVPETDGEAAAGFAKGVADALGPIAALVCATGAFDGGAIGRDPAGQLQELLQANLLAPANLARAVVGPMKRRKHGRLVFVGSAGVGSGGAGAANYLASKAALHEWVRALDHEVAADGVRATAVVVGTIDTPANRAAMPDADRSQWVAVEQVVEALLLAAFDPGCVGPSLRLQQGDRAPA